jgi:hypothetical protein
VPKCHCGIVVGWLEVPMSTLKFQSCFFKRYDMFCLLSTIQVNAVHIMLRDELVVGATKTDLFDQVFGIYMLWGIQKQ